MSETEEIAKAIQEASKLGEKSLGTAEKVGGFFAKVFKEPTAEVVGMITDKLRFIRWQRTLDMADKVEKILSDRGVTSVRSVPPKLALPILEESSLEDDETLQKLWTNLLANAMDPNFKVEVRSAYIGIIKELEPIDAEFLKKVYNLFKNNSPGVFKNIATELKNMGMHKEGLIKNMEIVDEVYEESMNNLFRVNCLTPYFDQRKDLLPTEGPVLDLDESDFDWQNLPRRQYTKEPIPLHRGTAVVSLTMLGKNFVEACLVD